MSLMTTMAESAPSGTTATPLANGTFGHDLPRADTPSSRFVGPMPAASDGSATAGGTNDASSRGADGVVRSSTRRPSDIQVATASVWPNMRAATGA